MKDKVVRNLLFGAHNKPLVCSLKARRMDLNFPPKEDGDISRRLRYPTHDGLVLTLLKKIGKLEERISKLENKLKSSKK